MKRILLILLLLPILSLACAISTYDAATPTFATPTIETPTIKTVDTPSPTLPPKGVTSTPVIGTVCFNASIASGQLRVRECPGLGCREIGLLMSGDQITTNGERKDMDGSIWLHILAPTEGWANSRYVCHPGGE